ncbi:MAG: hypothetical protein HY645_02350 [Acidobacteria bacterium]|nr:hypothetical protein [Acidobacteriota bacterium]
MSKKERETKQKAIEETLKAIIDDWYENVSQFYVTQEGLAFSPDLKTEEELKRFHDENGHRIKFNKQDLDFTYGLRSGWNGDNFFIEVSVNNKVENFSYKEFRNRLLAHYEKFGEQKVSTPYDLKNHTHMEIFKIKPNLDQAFVVEKREDKADIMRLSFQVEPRFLEKLVAHPMASKQLIESYCVSPFRTVYATVYRRSAH